MLWDGRAGKAWMRRDNDLEALCQKRQERYQTLRAVAPVQEEQRSPCPLADDLQVDTLYGDGVNARLHRWPLLPVTVCNAITTTSPAASYARMLHEGKAW
jgi:hypothetical protein